MILEELLKETNIQISNYKGMTKIATFYCKKHGYFYKTPKNFLRHQCNQCTKERLHSLYAKTQKEFLDEAKKKFPIYDYSKVNYINSATKVIIICPAHGEFSITPNNFLRNHGCAFCSKKENKYTIQDLVNRASKIHNYDYSKANKSGINSIVTIICPTHGEFKMSWNNHINNQQKCPKCNYSFGENKLEEFLNKKNISFKRNKTFSDLKDDRLLSYDFYIEEKNLLIECQGQQHYYNSFHKPLHEFHKQLHHDWLKRKYANKNKINLLIVKYTNYRNIEEVLEDYLNGK